MSRRREVLVGERFDKVIITAEVAKHGYRRRFQVLCDCGVVCEKNLSDLVTKKNRGSSISCGCWLKVFAVTHGMSGRNRRTPEYSAWIGIKQRCFNHNNTRFKDYGGRGISMDITWKNSFQVFFDALGPRPSSEYSVDRINNDLGYFPGNVKWSTRSEQQLNRRFPKSAPWCRGEKNNFCKLTEASIRTIRKLYKNKKNSLYLTKKFSVSQTTIHDIVNRRTWKHIV